MKQFIYSYPTKVYFGDSAFEEMLKAEAEKMGEVVMLAYGGGSIKKTGLYDEITGALKKAGKRIVDFSGIMSNPTYAKVKEGIALAKKENVDFILAAGGGSVLDCCKIISAGAKTNEDIWTMQYEQHKFSTDFLPMGMFTLVIVHNILNRFWWRSQTRNLRVKTPYGMMQKIVICLLVLCMLGSMMSGIYISRYVFRSVFSSGRNTVFADRIHLFCAYWGFALMGVHLGMHARTILGIRKMKSGSERMRTIVFAMAAVYGAVASARRRFWAYFFLQNHFFAEFGVPLLPYLIDYLFILLMFGFIGFLISEWMIGITKRKRHV